MMLLILPDEAVIRSIASVAAIITPAAVARRSGVTCAALLLACCGAVGVVGDGRGQLLHRRRRFLDGRGLLGRALAEIVGARQDFGGRGLEAARGAAMSLVDDAR